MPMLKQFKFYKLKSITLRMKMQLWEDKRALKNWLPIIDNKFTD